MTSTVLHPAPGRLVLADLAPQSRTRDLVLVVGRVLFTAALAQLAVPVPGSPVPITGQTLAVVLTAAALGPIRGVGVQALYLLATLVGLPFYSDARGGWDAVFGATGGYVVGFLPAALLIGLAAQYGADRHWWRAFPLFIAGQAVIFAVGVPWLAVAANLSAERAFELGFVPFILGGLVKAALGSVLLPGAWRIARWRGER